MLVDTTYQDVIIDMTTIDTQNMQTAVMAEGNGLNTNVAKI